MWQVRTADRRSSQLEIWLEWRRRVRSTPGLPPRLLDTQRVQPEPCVTALCDHWSELLDACRLGATTQEEPDNHALGCGFSAPLERISRFTGREHPPIRKARL